MMRYFCTYFDRHFLTRGIALYHSLRNHCQAFRLFVLCMDESSYRILSQLDLTHASLIPLESFEKGDEDLLSAKRNRSPVEYYFTCTPSLPLYVLAGYPEVDLITYLDADLFFFANPEPVYAEIGNSSIAIIGHRFSPHLQNPERHGIYNVGWVSFRRDQHGLACLRWWRDHCIEWCYDQSQDGRYGDQKYLDDWPKRFQDVVVLLHKGVNLAPWNLSNYEISDNTGRVWVDEQPLIFFHFHGFNQISSWICDTNLASYKVNPRPAIVQGIYAPYIRRLSEVQFELTPLFRKFGMRTNIRGTSVKSVASENVSISRRILRRVRVLLRICKGTVTRKYLLTVNGRIVLI